MSNPIAVPGTVVPSGSLSSPGGAQGVQGISGIGAQPQEVGTIKYWPVATPPTYWLNCDGSAISRSLYPDLYALIGTTYGSGDGTTTFNLPDLRGRVGLGVGQGSSLTNRLLAAIGGEESHALSVAELAAHSHNRAVSATGAAGSNAYIPVAQGSGTGGNQTDTQGGGTGHNNMQPFLVINFIIKVTREVPLNNPVAPIADTTTAGLVNKLSGNATDYVGGDNVCHAVIDNSHWSTFTPTVNVTGGAATATCRYKQIGKTVNILIIVTCTTAGSFGSCSIPVAAQGDFMLTGRERARTGVTWVGIGGANSIGGANYNNAAAMSANDVVVFSGSYEAA